MNTVNSQCMMSKDGILFNLKKGLESEYRAKDLCQSLLEMLTNEEDKEKVRQIIVDEEKHVKITKNLIRLVEEGYQGK